MTKGNLKDKLDGNELDLSLSNLEVVPVKEIAAIPKATHLDLSCNLLVNLPPEFTVKLRHLTKLDISKNRLTELPEQFGYLQNLQTLDVYSNQLQVLPLSFGYLKNLKWLDLKDNPLVEPFASVAGDCLDDFQCRTCARNMVLYTKKLQSDNERERQKKLKEEQDKETAKKAEEELEKQKMKAQKKADKDEKRKQYMAQQAARKQQERASQDREVEEDLKENGDNKNKTRKNKKQKSQTGGFSCCGLILATIVALLAIIIGIVFYCDSNSSVSVCKPLNEVTQPHLNAAKNAVKRYVSIAGETMYSCLNSTEVFVRKSLKQVQDYYEAYVKNKDKVQP